MAHVILSEKICTRCLLPKTQFPKRASRVCLKCYNRHKVRYTKARPRERMLRLARYRAKRDGLPFNLTIDDIVVPEFCPVLGIKLRLGEGLGGSTPCSPSLDKIIPHLGYVKGNVAVISKRANAMKLDATAEEIEKLLNWMRLQ